MSRDRAPKSGKVSGFSGTVALRARVLVAFES